MDTVSAFMAFYTWVKDPGFMADIGKTVVGRAAYDIFKTLGTSFVFRVHRFFSNKEEAERYFEQICSTSVSNTKEPYQDIVNLFEKLSTNTKDEKIMKQFIEELKRWFTDNSHEINILIKDIKPVDETNKIVDNFINVYKNHGIKKDEIITVVPSKFRLKIKDFENEKSIGAIIDRNLLEWTSSHFDVQLKWLCGTTPFIYSCESFSNIQGLFNLILYTKYVKEENVQAYLFKSEELDYLSENRQCVSLIFKISKQGFYKYVPIRVDWDWGYQKSRYDIKHVIYFLERIGVYIYGYKVDSNVVNSLLSGSVFLEESIKNKKETWCPDDYIDFRSENVSAKETIETQRCRVDFYEKGYKKNIEMEIDKIIADQGYRQCVKGTVLCNFTED